MKALIVALFLSKLVSAASITWTMINVNADWQQGDAHVLQMPDGKKFLIDAAGNNDSLLNFVKSRKISSFDAVWISHLHKDHYDGLVQLLNEGVVVKEVRVNFPNQSVCDAEKPWGCDWEHVQAFKEILIRRKIPIKAYKNGETLYEKDAIKVKVLAAYDGIQTPIGKTDINDMSAILKVTNGEISALFTGDLNFGLGGWLATNSDELKADILKVPHHGGESLAPEIFFDKVGAETYLVPTTKALWADPRTLRVREYVAKKKGKTFVNGLDGDIHVLLNAHSYTVRPERQDRRRGLRSKAIHVSKLFLK